MNRLLFPIIAVLFVGVILGFTFSVSADENLIPSWIKNTAGFWVNDQISDSEFINALQFLVKEGILVIPVPTMSPDMSIPPNPNDAPQFQPPTSSTSAPITERIDGPFALMKIDEMNVFTLTADKEKIAELLLKETDESEFLLGVISGFLWDGIIGDGDSKISINGTDVSLIPFRCDYDGTWMYNVNIQKQTDDEDLMVIVFKNGVQLNSSRTESPFGTVALDGDCTNPPLS